MSDRPAREAPTQGSAENSARPSDTALPGGWVVFAVGNPSRGDDAIGPALMARLRAWLPEALPTAEVALVEDFQLQVEHALDLAGRAAALFIDAGSGTPAPYRACRIAPAGEFAHTSHALGPETVLHVYRTILHRAPPPAFLLCVRGESFELGAPLSATARRHLDAAWDHLQAFCLQASTGILPD